MKAYLLLICLVLGLLTGPLLAVHAATIDTDKDGLSDDLETKFKTDPNNPDTDGDSFKDGQEVDWGYDPLAPNKAKLSQKIAVSLKGQKLYYLVGGIELKAWPVSSGKAAMPTPKGEFKVVNKSKKAWSKKYGLWMPYWLGLGNGEFGIHELPIWPNGYREGSNHLGKAVSHGCIRLGIGPAQYLFDRVATGTKVQIY